MLDCICCRQASIYLICVWGPCSGQSASLLYTYLIFTVIIIAVFQMRKLKIRKVFWFKFTQLKRISGCQFTYSLEASKFSTTACLLLFASVQWLLMTHSVKSKLLKQTPEPLMAWTVFVLPPSSFSTSPRNKHLTYRHRGLCNFPHLPSSFRPSSHWSHFSSS